MQIARKNFASRVEGSHEHCMDHSDRFCRGHNCTAVAGIIARLLSPGPNNPSGFILTTVLGVGGAFLATFLGQLVGWYRPDQGAGFIGATAGAIIVLFIWNRLAAARVISDPGAGSRT
jgi:uncharacterized membrane protein YeaQ/YmgE (transglycosylase-associated protein family)